MPMADSILPEYGYGLCAQKFTANQLHIIRARIRVLILIIQ